MWTNILHVFGIIKKLNKFSSFSFFIVLFFLFTKSEPYQNRVCSVSIGLDLVGSRYGSGTEQISRGLGIGQNFFYKHTLQQLQFYSKRQAQIILRLQVSIGSGAHHIQVAGAEFIDEGNGFRRASAARVDVVRNALPP